MNGSDQDSDFGLTTNQADIVAHAKSCYLNYPTIVNNIPKEKNTYKNTMNDFAAIDSGLAKSQTDIGESSNLAQIAQTYACNFKDTKYIDYVCILSVLAQVAIDNAKRRFDIDLGEEIKRIKKDMDITTHKYPKFWSIIKHGFNKKNINPNLNCPMNYLSAIELNRYRNPTTTLPMSEFFIKHKLNKDRKQCRKVEALISKYSLVVTDYNIQNNNDNIDWILLRSDFDELIKDIKATYISSNYDGLISWLIDRAFMISPQINSNSKSIRTIIHTNKSVLLKILYSVNPNSFLKCFKSAVFDPTELDLKSQTP